MEALRKRLEELGQGHLFHDDRADAGCSEQDWEMGMERLTEQLGTLDAGYPGGLEAYIQRARELLGKSQRGENPFDRFERIAVPSPMTRFRFDDFQQLNSELSKAEQLGMQILASGRCACVLVAGGLGERLGYSGIKIELPSETTSMTTFLQLYCEYIKAFQRSSEGAEIEIPFVIMTSDDTHVLTKELLERENNYGLARNQITLLKQEKVASLKDNQATIALDPEDRFSVLCKPHGHGDVHLLLHQSGTAESWIKRGVEWVLFFQDTNPMSFRTMPATLGVSAGQDIQVNSIAIPRKAKAAAGAIMRLEGGSEQVTINVEYNYIDGLLRKKFSPQGDVNDDTGYSPFPGNMNQLVFKLEPYVEALKQTKGIIPEFVNPKYTDGEHRSKFKPTRLECMMQDYPLTLKGDGMQARIGVTLFQDTDYEIAHQGLPGKVCSASLTHRLYAPAKNNLKDAVKKAALGIPDASTTSTELAIYASNSLMLKACGCDVQDPTEMTSLGGISQPEWPHIVFLPSFLPLFSDLRQRFTEPKNVHISSTSSLVLSGCITFTGPFHLDGALQIHAAPGTKLTVTKVFVENKGQRFTEVDPDDVQQDEIYRIRGYKPHSDGETYVMNIDAPGSSQIEIIQNPG